MPFTDPRQRDVWIPAVGDQLLFTLKTILGAPQLAAVGVTNKKSPRPSESLIALEPGLTFLILVSVSFTMYPHEILQIPPEITQQGSAALRACRISIKRNIAYLLNKFNRPNDDWMVSELIGRNYGGEWGIRTPDRAFDPITV